MQKLSSAQLRAARALLDWSRADLAKHSGISAPTIHRLENGINEPELRTLEKLIKVFDRHGVEFSENQGVRFKPNNIDIYDGADRFDDFYDFLYEHLKQHGGDVSLSIADERLLLKYRKDPTLHYKRMQDLCDRGVIKSFRVLANKSYFANNYPYNLYKWQPASGLAPTAFYAFGDCLALMSFADLKSPHIVVIHSGPIAEEYRRSFNIAWKQAKPPPRKT